MSSLLIKCSPLRASLFKRRLNGRLFLFRDGRVSNDEYVNGTSLSFEFVPSYPGLVKTQICFFIIVFLSLSLFQGSAARAEVSTDAAKSSDEAPIKTPPATIHLYEDLKDHDNSTIFRHKPVYFAYSNPLTKVQLSFRSALIDDWPFYFGYTQVIFWELGEESKPFLDATYNPEFFYTWTIKGNKLKTLDLGIWEHQSNGKGGTDSRSFDQSYLRLNYAFETRSWVIAASAKLSYMYNNDQENQDIDDYIGPWEFNLKFIQVFPGIIDKSELSLTAHPGGQWGTDWAKGGYEVSYNFRLGGVKVVPAFYIQYFTGYGETLLTYNQKEDQYRFGLLF